MTNLEVIDSARRILKDRLPATRTFPDDTSGFFEDTEMLDWLYWSTLEYQNKLVQTDEGWFVTSTSINLVANQEEYSMPCACLKVVRVEDIQNTSAPVEIAPIAFNDKDKYLNRTYLDNTSGVGAVGAYAIKGDKFIFRPRPSSSLASGVRVYYHRRAEKSIIASECSVIPNEYHELLVWGVVENGLIKQEATAEALASVLTRRNRLVDDLLKTGENRQIQKSRTVRLRK